MTPDKIAFTRTVFPQFPHITGITGIIGPPTTNPPSLYSISWYVESCTFHGPFPHIGQGRDPHFVWRWLITFVLSIFATDYISLLTPELSRAAKRLRLE